MILQNNHINEYINLTKSKPNDFCEEQHLLIKNILIPVLEDPTVRIDNNKVDEAIAMMEEYFYKLLPWQKFLFACMMLTYSNDTLVFREFFIMIGRGNGKTGMLSPIAWYFTTRHYGVEGYNIAVVSNSEDQAKLTFKGIKRMLDKNKAMMKKSFKWNLEGCTNIATGSEIEYYTNNAKTKDGFQPGLVIFDEEHTYESYDSINVFISALGKVKYPRIVKITTDGYFRGGVLDDDKEIARLKLNNDVSTRKKKLFPFIFKMDSEDEVKKPELWVKANPSLPYFPILKDEMEQAFIDIEFNDKVRIEFFTKRMNLPKQDEVRTVASWEKICAITKYEDGDKQKPLPLPDLSGWECLGGLDYASIRDFCGCYLLFRKGDQYYGIHHSFICKKSPDLSKIRFDYELACEKGLATMVDGDTLNEDIVVDWFFQKSKMYTIKKVCCDVHRFRAISDAFSKIGWFQDDGKNGGRIILVRNGYVTHSLVAPEVEKIFNRGLLTMEDDMMFRWYTYNVLVKYDSKGNVSYLKQDPEKRKTDGFMSFIHALSETSNHLKQVTNVAPKNYKW